TRAVMIRRAWPERRPILVPADYRTRRVGQRKQPGGAARLGWTRPPAVAAPQAPASSCYGSSASTSEVNSLRGSTNGETVSCGVASITAPSLSPVSASLFSLEDVRKLALHQFPSEVNRWGIHVK